MQSLRSILCLHHLPWLQSVGGEDSRSSLQRAGGGDNTGHPGRGAIHLHLRRRRQAEGAEPQDHLHQSHPTAQHCLRQRQLSVARMMHKSATLPVGLPDPVCALTMCKHKWPDIYLNTSLFLSFSIFNYLLFLGVRAPWPVILTSLTFASNEEKKKSLLTLNVTFFSYKPQSVSGGSVSLDRKMWARGVRHVCRHIIPMPRSLVILLKYMHNCGCLQNSVYNISLCSVSTFYCKPFYKSKAILNYLKRLHIYAAAVAN